MKFGQSNLAQQLEWIEILSKQQQAPIREKNWKLAERPEKYAFQLEFNVNYLTEAKDQEMETKKKELEACHKILKICIYQFKVISKEIKVKEKKFETSQKNTSYQFEVRNKEIKMKKRTELLPKKKKRLFKTFYLCWKLKPRASSK